MKRYLLVFLSVVSLGSSEVWKVLQEKTENQKEFAPILEHLILTETPIEIGSLPHDCPFDELSFESTPRILLNENSNIHRDALLIHGLIHQVQNSSKNAPGRENPLEHVYREYTAYYFQYLAMGRKLSNESLCSMINTLAIHYGAKERCVIENYEKDGEALKKLAYKSLGELRYFKALRDFSLTLWRSDFEKSANSPLYYLYNLRTANDLTPLMVNISKQNFLNPNEIDNLLHSPLDPEKKELELFVRIARFLVEDLHLKIKSFQDSPIDARKENLPDFSLPAKDLLELSNRLNNPSLQNFLLKIMKIPYGEKLYE